MIVRGRQDTCTVVRSSVIAVGLDESANALFFVVASALVQ